MKKKNQEVSLTGTFSRVIIIGVVMMTMCLLGAARFSQDAEEQAVKSQNNTMHQTANIYANEVSGAWQEFMVNNPSRFLELSMPVTKLGN